MKRWIAVAALLLPAPVLAAPDVATYRALAVQDLRLATIGYRLASANAPFCDVKGYNPGWVIHDIVQYPDAKLAKTAFGFATPLAVSGVVPGGPADKAGIKAGDGVVSVRYAVQGFTWAPDEGKAYERVAAYKQILADGWQSVNLPTTTFRRDGKDFESAFEPPLVCGSDFQVDTKRKADAGANGQMVRITSGMMEFATDDSELAAAVAHELSHNLLRHADRLKALGKKKTGKDVKATEIEADRLSVWLLANAGYDLDTALRFWTRWGSKFPISDSQHPGWKSRIASMGEEIAKMQQTPRVDGLLPPPLLAKTPAQ